MGKLIIDAHSHLWLRQHAEWNGMRIETTSNGRSFFLGEEVQMLPPFIIDGRNTAEVFLSNMNYAQVGGTVVVQEFIDGLQNDYLLQVAQQWPDRFITCGMPDYFSPDRLQQARRLIGQGFQGIAIPGHRLHTDTCHIHLNQPDMMEMFRLMEKEDIFLSVTLASGDSQTGELREVIEECPRLRIAIGHFCMPTEEGWQEQVKLARHDNVYIESGGITWLYNSEFYPFPSAIRAIREAADLVGMGKLMWGSDYPRTITAITYHMSYDFVEKSDALTDDEKRLFLGENARQFYRFGPLPDLPYVKNMSE